MARQHHATKRKLVGTDDVDDSQGADRARKLTTCSGSSQSARECKSANRRARKRASERALARAHKSMHESMQVDGGDATNDGAETNQGGATHDGSATSGTDCYAGSASSPQHCRREPTLSPGHLHPLPTHATSPSAFALHPCPWPPLGLSPLRSHCEQVRALLVADALWFGHLGPLLCLRQGTTLGLVVQVQRLPRECRHA